MMSLEKTTAALKRCNDKLEHPERPSTNPPAPVELSDERTAEIALLLTTHSTLLTVLHLNGVSGGEVFAFCGRAKR